jgi:hypothetical protein
MMILSSSSSTPTNIDTPPTITSFIKEE